MNIYSYIAADNDLLEEVHSGEALLDLSPTGWWTTRDAAFFALLRDRMDYLVERRDDAKYYKEEFQDAIDAFLNPANWALDPEDCPYYLGAEGLWCVKLGRVIDYDPPSTPNISDAINYALEVDGLSPDEIEELVAEALDFA